MCNIYHIPKYIITRKPLRKTKPEEQIILLRQDSQSSYSFGKIQNVGETGLSEKKKISVSLEKDFIFRFYIINFEICLVSETSGFVSPFGKYHLVIGYCYLY